MRQRALGCLVVVVVLLTACRQNTLTPEPATLPAPTATTVATDAPTQTPLPAVTPTSELKPDTEHILMVTAIQDRPNEMPERPPREDLFAEVDPWSIADAFSPAEGMRFFALETTFLNLSETSWRVIGSKLVLTDTTGKGYPAQLGRAFYGLVSFELRYGQKSQGWVVFEIPEDAVPQEIMYPVDDQHWIVSPVDVTPSLPDSDPHLVTSTSASGSNLTLSLISIKDPGTPFSIFSYIYIFGYRPVNIMIEVSNLSAEEVEFRPFRFVLMDENGVLHINQPGGSMEEIDGNELQPGETRRGEVSFDLLEGVQPHQLFYEVLPYTDQYLQISVQR